ncbi:methionine aminotransferase [Daejeonella sp.]|uniref:methionine aminotransferase n=1 Tax=Daejeonella sp. TaxID=2805397 RepID=UPI002718532F|nr:methionine aminotransferase [Daejeonella sp.]MDO8992121.1 methionine aminotransferase [Daejeonella sp.]MDP2414495.1 methionine aminotransferase [Daejeonella sp.]
MHLKSKLPDIGTTIFTVMSKLASEHKAINLSQGFPDYECSPQLVELVNHYMKSGYNQYAPMAGIYSLRERIAEKQEKLHQAKYNPETEITITSGGTQAIFTSIACVIQPGDEAIIFEPAYDSYTPSVILFGGIVRSIELSAPDYIINWQEVRQMVNEKTRMIIINTPNNPTAKTLTEEDMAELISITRDTNILIISDEVYEHLVYDGRKHLSISQYPELMERSFITASFGKLLHTTGWKVGYCLAPEWLMKEFRKVHQFEVFSVNSAVQYAISAHLLDERNYLEISDFFQNKKDFFYNLMKETRFDLLPCYGSYFQSVQYSRISDEGDTDLAKRIIREFGVASIPFSAFYRKGTDHRVLRFCFAKKHETLEKAVIKLAKI